MGWIKMLCSYRSGIRDIRGQDNWRVCILARRDMIIKRNICIRFYRFSLRRHSLSHMGTFPFWLIVVNIRSNDVANAVGPLATIYLVWQNDTVANTLPVPIWVLAFGGSAIVLGFITWGYNVMKNVGNRLTLHSPTRGFSMELGTAMTVLAASRLGIPISTAQCIVGA